MMNLLKKVKIQNSMKMFLLLGIFLIVIGGVLLVPKAFASPVPVRSVTITSEKLDYTKKDPGSFNIEKSAEWIAKGKARITFDVNTIAKIDDKHRDIIFVLDVSGSMEGEKIAKVKQDSIELISSLLSKEDNRAALITFETTSQLIYQLTNDEEKLVDAINNLTPGNMTNYYQALVNVDNILKEYKREENRECLVLFLTDGYPNEEIPNEEGEYKYLKKQYPYIVINGIQYEMGSDILEPIKKVSDSQFLADIRSLNNVLFEASVAPKIYDNFQITDYINNDYFEIDSVDTITSTIGNVKLEYENNTPKVTWNIENLRSGADARLTIDIKLKDEFLNKGGTYPTNKKEEVTSKIDEIAESIISTKTPVLRDNYQVIYDANTPSGCSVKNLPETTTRSVLDTVEVSSNIPTCNGYQFKGWTIITKNIKKVSKDYFIMPESDVTIRTSWGKNNIVKSMEGKVVKEQLLYDFIKDQATIDNQPSKFVTATKGIDFLSAPSDTNGKGVYTRYDTVDSKYPVHYFRGAVENNNVKFAGFCWKIVRTTEKGGIKLIYNGTPDENGGCTIKKGETTQIGMSGFSYKWNSPADSGYMYGTRYEPTEKMILDWYYYIGRSTLYKSNMSTTEYYYGDSVTYDEGTNTYTLTNATKYLWSDNYRNLKGKYTCFSTSSSTCQKVLYLESISSSYTDYLQLTNGETYDSLMNDALNVKWIYGNDVEYRDGKYYLIDKEEHSPVNLQADYETGFNAHRYTCFNKEDSCTSVNYIYYGYSDSLYYIELKDGKKIEEILKEMVSESSNTNDSEIKTMLDDWYSKNLVEYTDMLEDTVWCNDRTMQKYGWDKDSKINEPLAFGGYERNAALYKPNLACLPNDRFTVSSENGNGKLTYPIALITQDEATLAGNGALGFSTDNYLYNEKTWWTLSPDDFTLDRIYGAYGTFNGGLYSYIFSYSFGVRPSIALAPRTMIGGGDGSGTNPIEVYLP